MIESSVHRINIEKTFWLKNHHFTLIGLIFKNLFPPHKKEKLMNWPQSLQSAERTLQKTTQMLHSWILQRVSTQVQLCEMGGVGLQSRDQKITAHLWQTAVNQPEWEINDVSREISQCLIMCWELKKMKCESPNSWSQHYSGWKVSNPTCDKELWFIFMSVSC